MAPRQVPPCTTPQHDEPTDDATDANTTHASESSRETVHYTSHRTRTAQASQTPQTRRHYRRVSYYQLPMHDDRNTRALYPCDDRESESDQTEKACARQPWVDCWGTQKASSLIPSQLVDCQLVQLITDSSRILASSVICHKHLIRLFAHFGGDSLELIRQFQKRIGLAID